ncbi:ATP-binding protein [Microbacterium sp. SSW1-59]|uniref:hybrid sensor histidine kinase/response regulator n=1 Tax=Microbacterium xanthum TaxID=3079794 RepID=UPI002AD3052A|nr:ATP-binding protein [Microbacterium sp. SSW1-59]MDZ8200405.1 ATP-binding protein [Microbacterium sp. SSW1-59]
MARREFERMPRPVAATFFALGALWTIGLVAMLLLPDLPTVGLVTFGVVEVGAVGLMVIRAARGIREGPTWWLVAAAVAALVAGRGLALLHDPALDALRALLGAAFVVLFIAGAASLARRRTSRRPLSLILDALIAAFGLAAVSALIVLRPFPGIRADDLMVLAEVSGPLLALGAMVGALTALGRAPTRAFWLVGSGIALVAAATVLGALIDASPTAVPAPPAGEGMTPPPGAPRVSLVGAEGFVYAVWPIAVLLIAWGVWASRPAPAGAPRSPVVTWLPYGFLFAALLVVVVAALVPVPPVAVLCATVALLLGAARFLVTVQILNALRRQTVDMNAKLEVANRETRAAADAKAAYLATMSHEIRTPMNAVVAMTGLLLATDLDRAQRDYVETVRRSGDMLLELVNDILDFSKIESGGLVLERRPFHLPATIEYAVALLGYAAADKNVQLRCNIDAAVPEGVLGDQTRVSQIIVNLVANAVKFTSEGSVTVEACTVGPDAVAIAVRDTGIGIPEDRRDRLFRSFSQVNSSTTRLYGGTGLGLAISKALSDAMGGEITVESEVGVGSEFTLTLPVERAEIPEPPGSADVEPGDGHRARAAETAERASGLRVLLADDNEINRKTATLVLQKLGHEVTVVHDGAAALSAAERNVWDVILMDVHMPGMDGIEATRRVRALPPPHRDVPIIALTASVDDDVLRAAGEAGADGVVGKPFRIHDLSAALERVAEGTRHAGPTPTPTADDPHPNPPLIEEDHVASEPTPVIDPEYREMLEEFPPERLAALIEKFEGQCAQAREGLAGRMDAEDFAGLLHKLVGSSGSLGLLDLARLVVTFETAVREGSAIPADQADRFEAETARATAALAELRG